ncbi:hypothetical protein [Gulosibacter chungangensis]|uniref:Uncharacterized protein n=1 Tax=Gulosibacter chungangensis TaxID=979746 RepID=A0A7J5B7G0_9MICO|nr:hypothetical protein [Gulosibacter chungangensis]KAB1640931.1 hypothetical protein F8O05_13510 [Gulosibacter chungangensis]
MTYDPNAPRHPDSPQGSGQNQLGYGNQQYGQSPRYGQHDAQGQFGQQPGYGNQQSGQNPGGYQQGGYGNQQPGQSPGGYQQGGQQPDGTYGGNYSGGTYDSGQQNPGYGSNPQNSGYGVGQQNPTYGYDQQSPTYGSGQQDPTYGSGQQNPAYGAGQQNPSYEQPPQPTQGNATYGQYAASSPAQPPKKGRKKWWIIGTAIVVVLGLATWGGIALFGKFGGARTPEAAVENYLSSVASFNIVDAALGTAPSEREIFQDAVLQIRDAGLGEAEGDGEREIPSIFDSLKDAQSALKITRDGFEYETEELVEGVEVVNITEGVITFDGDEEAFKEALVNLARGMRYEAEVSSGTPEDEALDLAFEMTDADLDVEFPYEYDLAKGNDDLQAFPEGLSMVTVQEGSGWYVSQIMTGIHLAATGLGTSLTGSEGWPIGDTVIDAQPAESPAAAGMQFADGLANYFSMAGGVSGVDTELGISTLTEAERTVASLYLLPWLQGFAESSAGGASFEYEVSGDFEEFEFGGKTMVLPDGLAISYDGDTALEVDGYCASVLREEVGCLTDWDAYSQLGWDQLGLVVVQEGGGWLVSPYQTVEIFLETGVDRYLELREDGDLHLLYG